jgi:hypothetical protein
VQPGGSSAGFSLVDTGIVDLDVDVIVVVDFDVDGNVEVDA